MRPDMRDGAVVVLFAMGLGVSPGVCEETPAPMPKLQSLVSGRAGWSGGGQKCRVSVVHVYYGRKDLRYKSFTVRHDNRIRQSSDAPLRPRLKIGEKGIWRLTRRAGGPLCLRGELFGVQLPAREIAPHYSLAVAMAELLERVSAARPEERPGILRDAAQHKDPRPKAMAVRMMAAFPSADGENLLWRLVGDDAQSPFVKMALDESLSNLAGENWRNSERREEFLMSCLESRLSSAEADDIGRRLSRCAQHKEIPRELLVELLRKGTLNENLEMSRRVGFLRTLDCVLERYGSEGEASEFLQDCVVNSPEEALRTNAAYVFVMAAPKLGEEILADIRELKQRVSDPKLKGILQQALDRASSGGHP